jgi:hypothetical protein
MTPKGAHNAMMICENVTKLPNSSFYNHTCDTWDKFFQCLAVEAKWDIANGGVYMPYAWSDESFTMPEHYANEIKAGIIDTQKLAADVQVWGYVSGGAVNNLIKMKVSFVSYRNIVCVDVWNHVR